MRTYCISIGLIELVYWNCKWAGFWGSYTCICTYIVVLEIGTRKFLSVGTFAHCQNNFSFVVRRTNVSVLLLCNCLMVDQAKLSILKS